MNALRMSICQRWLVHYTRCDKRYDVYIHIMMQVPLSFVSSSTVFSFSWWIVLQNLDWSLELYESSCDLALTNKVSENMISLSKELGSIPIFFYFMMKEIILSSEDAVLAMIDRLKTMKLSVFKGEDVSKVTGQLRMAIFRLKVLNKVSIEINKHILAVL